MFLTVVLENNFMRKHVATASAGYFVLVYIMVK